MSDGDRRIINLTILDYRRPCLKTTNKQNKEIKETTLLRNGKLGLAVHSFNLSTRESKVARYLSLRLFWPT